MGISSNAILFYGYCWDDETDLFDSEAEWSVQVLLKRGEKNPFDSFSEENPELPYQERHKQWTDKNREAIDDWHAKGTAVEKEFGVDVGCHCHGDYSIPYIFAGGSELTAYRGHPKKVETLAKQQEWDAKLDRFLAEFGIEKPQKSAAWWLVSYMG